MSKFEQGPGEGHDKEYLNEDDMLEKMFAILEAGGTVRLVMGDNVTMGTMRDMVDILREAGAEVIVPSDN